MKRYVIPNYELQPTAFYPTSEMRQVVKEDNGTSYVVYEKVEIDPMKVNEGLKAIDFALDVLMDNNAVDLLKENKLINLSKTAVMDTATKMEE